MTPVTMPRTLIGLIGLMSTQMAFAHGGHGETGIAGGLSHSFAAPEHVLALIGFGAWAVLVCRGTAWRLLAVTLCAVTLGGVIGWLGPGAPMADSVAAVGLLSAGLLIVLRERLNPFAATVGLIALAAVQGYLHGAAGQGVPDPAGFALGTILASALMMVVGASLGGALRVDRAVQAGGLA